MRPWFVGTTIVLFVGVNVFVEVMRRRSAAAQLERLNVWEHSSAEAKLEILRKMKTETIREFSRLWRNGIVFAVMFIWFVPVSIYLEQQDRDLQRAVDCRNGNDAARATREGRFADIEAISAALLDEGVDMATVERLEARRRASVPTVEETDDDCDHDGVIGDPGDYP